MSALDFNEVMALVGGLIGLAALVLQHLRDSPSKQVAEQLAKMNARQDKSDGRLDALENWKNG